MQSDRETQAEPRVELAVVIPVFGCGGCLESLHERIRATVESLALSYEVIYVDDCSPDGAWETLEALAAADHHVRAYQLSRNFGQDAAITAGLSRSSARWTIVMDCDLQEPPEAIPALLRKAREGYAVVRTLRDSRRHSRWRHVASRLYRRALLESAGGQQYSSMSLLTPPVVEAFMTMTDRDREYALMIDWLGFSQATVPIDFAERPHGSSAYTLRGLIRVAIGGMFFRSTILLRAVVLLGFVVALLGAALSAYEVYFYFAFGQPAGYTSLVVIMLLTSGFIITSVGIVGLYVGRVFDQVRARPLFVVSREARRRDNSAPSRTSEVITDDPGMAPASAVREFKSQSATPL